jgi:predicted nucleotidyltransferase
MNQTQEDQTIDLPDAFLADLVRELDHGDIVGITLGGSYARGEATQYSDVDLACFWREGLRPPPKRFMYRQGRLISVKMTSVAEIRGMLGRPESALFFAGGKHRLLLDKDGSVARLMAEIEHFRWESLRADANQSISLWMALKAEDVQKILREFQYDNLPGLAYTLAGQIEELTLLTALYYGEFITSNSTYYQQVEEAAGSASAWTQYHRIATGLEDGPEGVKPLRARGIAALYLYRETLAIVRPVMRQEHLAVVEEVLRVVGDARERLPFTEEEYAWLKRWM